MKANEASLLKLMASNDQQFVVPVYQREYNWEKKQVLRLWQDIEGAAAGRELTHFFGSIVYIAPEEDVPITGVQQYLVIDGQQRLTTVTLLLTAFRTVLSGGAHGEKIDVDIINDHYLFNMHDKGDHRIKLVLGEEDREEFAAILQEGKTEGLSRRRLRENYDLLLELAKATSLTPDQLYEGIARLTVVDVRLKRNVDDPQRIFESLNSTGLDLTQSDLVRNFILMDLDPDTQSHLFKKYWRPITRLVHDDLTGSDHFDEFLRDYLTMCSPSGEIPKIDHIYDTFKDYRARMAASNVEDLVRGLWHSATLYAQMLKPLQYLSQGAPALGDTPALMSAPVLKALGDLNRMDLSVSYPIVLELLDDHATNRISEDQLLRVLRIIESYVVRRLVCSLPANSLSKTFARLSREIDKTDYVDSVGAALLGMSGSRRFPTDEEFRESCKVKDIYHQQTRAKYILEKLENSGKKEPISGDNYSVEHVMPQTLTDEWRESLGEDWERVHLVRSNTLGNLTLTGYNSEYSNLPFLAKRDLTDPDGNLIGFRGSPVTLNGDLAVVSTWSEAGILRRCERLSSLACFVWPMATTEVVGPAPVPGSPNLDSILSTLFPMPEALAWAQVLVTELVKQLSTASARRLLAATFSGERISFDVGVWLILRFAASKNGGCRVVLAIDRTRLNKSSEIADQKFDTFSSTVLGNRGDAFEPGRFGLVALDWHPGTPLPSDLMDAWIAGIDGAMAIFKLWQTGAFSHLHSEAIIRTLAPSLSEHPYYEHFLHDNVGELFTSFQRRVLELDSELTVERLASYIAFKLDTNVLDVVPKSDHLTIYLNMPFDQVADHESVVHDISGTSHAGNGDVMFDLRDADGLDVALELVDQALRRQRED